MAVGIATCTCSVCGAQFERRAKKYNRTEANAWAEWAEKNITICPDCWAKQKAAEKAETFKKITEGIALAELDGSPKQISWATDIRESFVLKSVEVLDRIRKEATKARYIELRAKTLEEMSAAHWWIEHRDKLEDGVIVTDGWARPGDKD